MKSSRHHIIMDFVAVHPSVIGAVRGKVRGVGTGLFHGLVCIADELKVGTIWGEATANSAPFYEKILGADRSLDHFFINGETMEHCRRQLGGMHIRRA
ncbi:MAG: hypothetical protein HY360_24075 [Verrucomicrobia bacterium]|nr:hypothetical protein [Verrucomicrobiota bacterium]